MSSTATVPKAEWDGSRDPESPGQQELQQEGSAFRARYRFVMDFVSLLTVKDGEVYEVNYDKKPKWYRRLLDAGVEENGIKPVPLEQRTSTQYSNLFTVFFTCLLCLLP
jgi:calcineurin-like phosphoesterase family protein